MSDKQKRHKLKFSAIKLLILCASLGYLGWTANLFNFFDDHPLPPYSEKYGFISIALYPILWGLTMLLINPEKRTAETTRDVPLIWLFRFILQVAFMGIAVVPLAMLGNFLLALFSILGYFVWFPLFLVIGLAVLQMISVIDLSNETLIQRATVCTLFCAICVSAWVSFLSRLIFG